MSEMRTQLYEWMNERTNERKGEKWFFSVVLLGEREDTLVDTKRRRLKKEN